MASSEMTELVPTGASGEALYLCKCRALNRERLLLVLFFRLLDNLIAAIESIRCNAVSQVRFSRGRIDRQRWTGKFVMGSPHAAR